MKKVLVAVTAVVLTFGASVAHSDDDYPIRPQPTTTTTLVAPPTTLFPPPAGHLPATL